MKRLLENHPQANRAAGPFLCPTGLSCWRRIVTESWKIVVNGDRIN